MKTEKYTSDQLPFGCVIKIPENCSKKPAMILALHGSGERGNGKSDLDKVMIHGFANIINDENLKDCILVMPQCPEDSFWVAKLETLKKFIDSIVKLYNVDENRIYLCGLSMGGYGTWYLAMAYPDMFAAIAPCCGGGMAWNAEVLKMPVWAFHGDKDDTVNPFNTVDMVKNLKKTNSDVHFTLFHDVGHNSWVKAFDEELLSWLLSKNKNDIKNTFVDLKVS